MFDITEIKPYPRNAKEHPQWHLEKIANSIKAFGCLAPIVLDKDGTIIAGHGRFWAMTDLLGFTIMRECASAKKGEPVIPYIIAQDLTENEIKAYRIADNKINSLTKENKELVVMELVALDLSGFDFTVTGFDKDFIIDNEPLSKKKDVEFQAEDKRKVTCPECAHEFTI